MLHHNFESFDYTRNLLAVRPVGGIGNRLLCVMSAIQHVALGNFDYLTIDWLSTHDCDIELDTLIEEIKVKTIPYECVADDISWDQENDDKVKGITTCSFIFSNKDDPPRQSTIDWLKENISQYIKFKKPEVMDLNEYTGLHCRRSDWGVNYSTTKIDASQIEKLHHKLDQLFHQFVLKFYHSKLFLATDSNKTDAYYKQHFKNIVCNNKSNFLTTTSRSKEACCESWIDLMSLSACRLIIRDSFSSFALVASIIGNTKLITWHRPFLMYAGYGIINK